MLQLQQEHPSMIEAEIGKKKSKAKTKKPDSNTNHSKVFLLIFKQKSWTQDGYNLIQK